MSSAVPIVHRLAPDNLDEAVDVFADAFADYPVMRFTVGAEGDVTARERRLVQLFVTRRVRRGGPMLGVRGRDGSLVAAAVLTSPAEPEPPADVAQISADAWRDLGDAARLRYDAYAAAASFFDALPPHHHLNMIGVRRAYAGGGLGRVLLDALRTMATEDSSSAGVSLTTENRRNVELYRHVGFDVIGHRVVGEYQRHGDTATLETWGMFAPASRELPRP
jgi:GNAT superfamily N-acetyltransferase